MVTGGKRIAGGMVMDAKRLQRWWVRRRREESLGKRHQQQCVRQKREKRGARGKYLNLAAAVKVAGVLEPIRWSAVRQSGVKSPRINVVNSKSPGIASEVSCWEPPACVDTCLLRQSGRSALLFECAPFAALRRVGSVDSEISPGEGRMQPGNHDC